MKLVFVVPRGAEAATVMRAQQRVRTVTVPAGASAATALPAFAPEVQVIVLGLCGALRERTVGDVVIYREVAGTDATIRPDAVLADALAAALPEAHAVRACEADHVVTRRAERVRYADRFAADVVDMECAALAAALAKQQLQFAMVRVVSDDARRDLPALDGVIRADGKLDAVRLLTAFARDPRNAFAFARDARRALAILGSTARELTSLSD
jgi:nucleoside phosphorylase